MKALDAKLDGKVVLQIVEHARDFWILFDELIDDVEEDGKTFLHNRDSLLEAFAEKRLFSLKMTETEFMLAGGARGHEIFAGNRQSILVSPRTGKGVSIAGHRSWYMLPCLCTLSEKRQEADNAVEILWVHSRARRHGLGSLLVRELHVSRTSTCRLDESDEFWAMVLNPKP